MVVLGVDACKRGWFAITIGDSDPVRGHFLAHLDELADHVADADGIAIDIPIGLPANQRRRADVQARAFIGTRRSSVFYAPPRAVLQTPSHREASETCRELTGSGVSQQSYALGPKIFEAEDWIARVGLPVWEIHPEVSFTVLMGHPAHAAKKTWTGMTERLNALKQAGIALDGIGGAGANAAADDVLDAAVAAWSARRLVDGDAVCFPDPPERDRVTGRAVAIWA